MMDVLMIALALGLFTLGLATPMPSTGGEENESWSLSIRSRLSLPSAC
jgi:hypothetical protein